MKLYFELSIPPSVNAAYYNVKPSAYDNEYHGHARKLTTKAKNWKTEAAYTAYAAKRRAGWPMPGPDEKIVLEVWAYWKDGHRRDMNNLHKLLCDALEGQLYPDDKMVLVRDMNFFIDRQRPRLWLCVYPLTDEQEESPEHDAQRDRKETETGI